MKRNLLCATFVLLLSAGAAWAQPPRVSRSERPALRRDTVRSDFGEAEVLRRIDSLASRSLWQPDYRSMEPLPVQPVVSMSSVVAIREEQLPRQVRVVDNMTLLGPHFVLSNGQAWNWGPYPDSFLDARTISLPMPR